MTSLEKSRTTNKKNSNQFFKNPIPQNIIFSFFEKNCSSINQKSFIFNKEAYKRSKLNETLNIFLDLIKNYYHTSKVKYIDNCTNYKKLLTIIRQICKYHNIEYTSKIQYFTSNYESQYTITFNDIDNIEKDFLEDFSGEDLTAEFINSLSSATVSSETTPNFECRPITPP